MTAILSTWYRAVRVVNYYSVRRRFLTTVMNWYLTPTPTIGWTTRPSRRDAQVRLQHLTMSSALAVFYVYLKRAEQLATMVNITATGTGNVQGTSNATAPSTGLGFNGPPNGGGDDRDRTDRAEWDWVAINEEGIECRPGRFEILHRNANVDNLDTLFDEGLPLLPGTDFSMRNHQRRSGERTGTDDPFYGATQAALYEYDSGPLAESSGRYVLVLKDAYGVVVESRVPSDRDPEAQKNAVIVIELEIIFRTVPGRKILCVLDKWTGKVYANPHLPAKETAEHVSRMTQLYKIGENRGFLPVHH